MKKIISVLGFLGILASTAPFASAAYFDQTPVTQCNIQITSTLTSGDEGDQVYTLQTLLNQSGYLYVQPNGHFGPSTKAALKRFQIANAIYPTGYVGPVTLNAVNERLCDSDVRADSMSYDSYGYSSYSYTTGVTYVDKFDKFVKVVSPAPQNPTLYDNPPTTVAAITNVAQTSTPVLTANTSLALTNGVALPASTQIASTNIIYSPYVGYTYGIVPQTGSLTFTSPLTNSVYNEGDTVNLAWTTSNINASQYRILLENTSSGQSKLVAVTSTNVASFVLTKEILDTVCSGTCDSNNSGAWSTGSFRIVVTTPYTDISGTTSNFRAIISPITIKRPFYAFASVSITGSKTPVDSGEVFRLYVNVPTPIYSYGQYSFKIRATCTNNVQVSIAGVPCGQDFQMPVSTNNFQREVPAMIKNTTWYRQDVTFTIDAVDVNGKVIGTASTVITANPAPFSW